MSIPVGPPTNLKDTNLRHSPQAVVRDKRLSTVEDKGQWTVDRTGAVADAFSYSPVTAMGDTGKTDISIEVPERDT